MQSLWWFRPGGLWLKGNTHTHTTQSDGKLTVEEVAAEYGKRRYDFVFLTDHWRRTVPQTRTARRPLLIPAEEIHLKFKNKFPHIVCLGINREWSQKTVRNTAEMMRLAKREGVSLIIGHPYWCGVRSESYLSLDGFLGVEVFNTCCDGMCKGYSSVHWDDLLDAGKKTLGFATDDFHNFGGGMGRGWVMVKAKACTEKAIMDAIRKGRFYSTQGPIIRSVKLRGRTVSVECSKVRRINFISNNCHGYVVKADRKDITRASWEIHKYSTYARIECIDRDGLIAWSNPVWVKSLWVDPKK
ncbi:MAG: PHP domain-containing protein [Planctomycetes bacterium]|nr:PHP domain-containing protein [Planctomycetota bacterium]